MSKEDLPSPLEDGWVEHPIEADAGGVPVRAMLRVNWGAMEVRLLSPAAGLTAASDRRSHAFAMMAHHAPQERFAYRGRATPKGLERGQAMAAGLYLDWAAVQAHADAVREACAKTRADLAAINGRIEEAVRPLEAKRRALRRAFKAGALTQADHQKGRKEAEEERGRVVYGGGFGCQLAGARFTERLEKLCGRRMGLGEAERLLAWHGVCDGPSA